MATPPDAPKFHPATVAAPRRAQALGGRLRALRAARRISQLELALHVGVSQRHLSCLETGRAGVSRATLLAILDALEAPLAERNATLHAAGFAPAYAERALDSAEMQAVRDAVRHLLAAHEPAPALLLDSAWNLLDANAGVHRLLHLLGLDAAILAPGPDGAPFNMLRATLLPGGLSAFFENADEVCGEVWRRATRESAHVPALATLVEELRASMPTRVSAPNRQAAVAAETGSPLMVARLRSAAHGTLTFFSTFTTFGSPLDVTVASLRIEHLFPADESTRRALDPAAP